MPYYNITAVFGESPNKKRVQDFFIEAICEEEAAFIFRNKIKEYQDRKIVVEQVIIEKIEIERSL